MSNPLHRQMTGATVGQDYGNTLSDDPSDPRGGKLSDGNYTFRVLEVYINDKLRNGGWIFVLKKQVVECHAPDCKLEPGEVVVEKYGDKLGDVGTSNIKRLMGNLFGYTDEEQINDFLSRDNLDWSTPLTVQNNGIARDVCFRQTITTGPYTTKSGKTYENLARRSLQGAVPQANLSPEALAFFPEGTREDRGLPYYHDINSFAVEAAPQAQPAQQQVTPAQAAPVVAAAPAAPAPAAAPAGGPPAAAAPPTPPGA